MMDCPADGCEKESPNLSGLGQHWSFAHEGPPPWKQQTCDYCGANFLKNDSQTTEGNTFCDSDCYGAYKSENLVGEELPWYEGDKNTEECAECGSEIVVCGSHRREQEHNFCDQNCYGEFERTYSERPYYGPKWATQRQKVLEKSDSVCVYRGCTKTESDNGRELDVHHIVPLSEFDSYDRANQVSNLAPVCAKHHGKIEKKPPEYFNK